MKKIHIGLTYICPQKMKFQTTLILLFVLVLAACSKYQRLLKSSDMDLKYEEAIRYYEEGDYSRAYPLLEELLPLYRGSDRAELLSYYYAYCNYNLGDFILAGYHFQKFYSLFPQSKYAEECMFMSGYCYYLNSPVYTLDQANSKEAIKEFTRFRNIYPVSPLNDSAMTMLNILHDKLEMKAYENAMLYFKTENYKASIVSFQLFLKDYPNTKYEKEINFLILKSSFLLAINSVIKKKEDRINDTIDAYYNFVDNFDDENYRKESESMYDAILKEREKLTKSPQ